MKIRSHNGKTAREMTGRPSAAVSGRSIKLMAIDKVAAVYAAAARKMEASRRYLADH